MRPLRATFVTLKSDNRLRGCIGTREARLPLVTDVAEHAYAAAFEDPRFPQLQKDELLSIHIEISVLSALEPLSAEFPQNERLKKRIEQLRAVR